MEWWEIFQEAFEIDEREYDFVCACGLHHYTVYESCWTLDPERVCDDEDELQMLIPEGDKIRVRDFPLAIFEYNKKRYVWYCECIKHNEELMSTWEWINRNGKGLVKILAHIRKRNYEHHRRLIEEIRSIVKED